MQKPLIVGLDLGTTLCKASAFEPDGTLVASAQRSIVTHRPQPGWAEQDPRDWIEAILENLCALAMELGPRAEDVHAVGLSSHGPCVILTDQNHRPMGRCTIWQDQRASSLLDELVQMAGEDWIGLGTAETSFAVQLLWLQRNNPEMLRRAAYLMDSKGYLLTVLTGHRVDEPSSSPSGESGNRGLFEALGIDTSRLPGSVPSLSIVGELAADICSQCGLPAGLPLVAGLNDGAAATLGAGVVQLGQGIVSLSTNGVMRTAIPRRIPGAELRNRSMFCYSYVDGMYITGGMTKSGADSVRWFIENFHQGHEDDPSIFETIAQEAALSPAGANGACFMPYLLGMGTPHPSKRAQGAFLNMGRHHTRADLTRAVLEGLAFAIRDIAGTFDELGLSWDCLRFTGGGSKNAAWRQIVSDVLGKPLSGSRSDSVLGAAICAAAASGLFPDVRGAVEAMVSTTFQVEPIAQNVEAYHAAYARFRQLKTILGQMSEDEA